MDMNTLTHEKRCAVVRCLVDGFSVRANVRITGIAKNTIQRITGELGEACLAFQDKMLRNITSKRIQCDEVWCFCYAKDKNPPDSMRGKPGVGSMWTWMAIDADSKLIVSWRLGARDAADAQRFMADVAERLANRIQLTTDGDRVYWFEHTLRSRGQAPSRALRIGRGPRLVHIGVAFKRGPLS
jgi:hypothetical protein